MNEIAYADAHFPDGRFVRWGHVRVLLVLKLLLGDGVMKSRSCFSFVLLVPVLGLCGEVGRHHLG